MKILGLFGLKFCARVCVQKQFHYVLRNKEEKPHSKNSENRACNLPCLKTKQMKDDFSLLRRNKRPEHLN